MENIWLGVAEDCEFRTKDELAQEEYHLNEQILDLGIARHAKEQTLGDYQRLFRSIMQMSQENEIGIIEEQGVLYAVDMFTLDKKAIESPEARYLCKKCRDIEYDIEDISWRIKLREECLEKTRKRMEE